MTAAENKVKRRTGNREEKTVKDDRRKRVLVTGSAGFIGSHLCERPLQRGYGVLCVGNFYTGTKRNIEPRTVEYFDRVLRHAPQRKAG